MAFYGYNGGVDECYSSNYGHDFGVVTQYSSSPYDLGEPILIDYSASAYSDPPINYDCSYDYSDYSVYQSETIYTQPNYLQYDPPPPHYQVYFPSQTKFTVSYSTSTVDFNEPEFPEYDQTPYGGGYDQRMTYGKPIPPSDLTCYPRSLPQSDAPPQNFSFASIPSPYGKDDDDHPPIKPLPPNPTDTKGETGRDSHVFDSIPSPHGKDDDHPPIKALPLPPKGSLPTPTDTKAETGRDSHVEPKDVISSGDYASIEHQNGFVPGSGLEAMDICESLFGYWPCVAKKAQLERNNCQVCSHDTTRMDPWKTAADYLFGSPVPYDYHNYHHIHHQSPYQADQISWLQ